eukprot:Gb_19805 [translate_table: standard]
MSRGEALEGRRRRSAGGINIEEKGSRRVNSVGRAKMKSRLAIPRLRSSRLSPMRLLDRFKQVLVRLMFSSASKGPSSPSTINFYNAYYCPDSHYNEAIADCIEFFNKSASNDNNV